VGLDNCFDGWDGQACLYWPQSGLALEMAAGSGLEHLVVFTPPEPMDFIAVEPVSHLNNAINRSSPQANGIVLLESGHQTERCLRINVRQLAAGATATA
jgi:aldose 1-epimerase